MAFDIAKAKHAAVGYAKDSLSRGCLFVDMPDEGQHDDSLGDAETLETIASMVLSVGVDGIKKDDAENELLEHLYSTFPAFV